MRFSRLCSTMEQPVSTETNYNQALMQRNQQGAIASSTQPGCIPVQSNSAVHVLTVRLCAPPKYVRHTWAVCTTMHAQATKPSKPTDTKSI